MCNDDSLLVAWGLEDTGNKLHSKAGNVSLRMNKINLLLMVYWTAHSHFIMILEKYPSPHLLKWLWFIWFISLIRLIFLIDGLLFLNIMKMFFSSIANLTEADDWLAALWSNINSAFSCRLCVTAFHISHPQWLLTLCRKFWPLGLRLELWGCILFCHIKMTRMRTT